MATADSERPITLVAGADLSTKYNCFVKMDTVADQCVLCGAGGQAVGVLKGKPLAGAAGRVVIGGKTVVIAGATITVGQKVSSDANGNARVAVTGDHVIGYAASAGAASAEMEVLLQPMGILA